MSNIVEEEIDMNNVTIECLGWLLYYIALDHSDILNYAPNASTEMLDRLGKSEDSSVLMAVARHPNTSIDTINHLYKSGDFGILWFIGLNPSAPEWILRALAKDKKSGFIDSVVTNPNAPGDLLEEIYGYENYGR